MAADHCSLYKLKENVPTFDTTIFPIRLAYCSCWRINFSCSFIASRFARAASFALSDAAFAACFCAAACSCAKRFASAAACLSTLFATARLYFSCASVTVLVARACSYVAGVYLDKAPVLALICLVSSSLAADPVAFVNSLCKLICFF